MAVELTTVPTETTLDLAADLAWLNDVSETPDAINKAVLWRLSQVKAADIASAATLNFDASTGDLVDVTGTTTVTTITLAEGRKMTVRFTGILTLTHGSSLVLPTAANITTVAGDFAVFRGYAAGVVRCIVYQRASGAALAGGGITNGAGNNVVPKSNGTNLVASSITDDGTTAMSTLPIGTDQANNGRTLILNPNMFGGGTAGLQQTGIGNEVVWISNDATSGDGINIRVNSAVRLQIRPDGNISMPTLPKTDPGTPGYLWDDNGVLSVSQ